MSPQKIKLKVDPFLMGMISMIVLAYFFQLENSRLNNIPIDLISSIGISLIFFFYGVKLSPEKLKAGLKNWKLHVVIQLSTFLLFPLLVLAFLPLVTNEQQQLIWMGLFFLSVLPSTVSSSVVMVSLAKGNIPSAIFNASISGLIGIFLTPLWLGPLLKNEIGGFDFSDLYLQLILEIIIPVILGMSLQKWLGKYAQRYSALLSNFDKSIILLIIYSSFSHSFASNLFSGMVWKDLGTIAVGVILLFSLVYYLIGVASNWLNFQREDKITAQFCGTKKSLVHGTVFFNLIFHGTGGAGIILIPLMLFHAVQLIIISYKATNLAKPSTLKLKKEKPFIYPFI
ncbi:bile acid:sodium symporter [Algoriphagus sp. AGSA1]|uniref:bile acid:sodium symporter family protein n=1 Tax=Algoriphagus sp. AGSA1 TaxID=2907213 RepID=UPI001F1B3E89|nr:bile acid:sodium symporter family protein [Algoriphagus sp. AGSA1]MCE7055442.1 bile acid:sodium symporter [Algoriphagus sp. AGSA1]